MHFAQLLLCLWSYFDDLYPTVSKERNVLWQNGGQRPITHGVLSLSRFQILPFLKICITDFSEPKKARKLKSPINMDNDWMYCVYQNRGKVFIALGVMSLGRFSNKKNRKMHFAY